jgi:hypothetical protein
MDSPVRCTWFSLSNFMLLGGLVLPAQDLPPGVLTLSRIRAHVQQTVDQLPDCTCIENIARYHKPAGKELKPLDTVVLQILFSGNKELFASPGDTRWGANPSEFIGSGMIGNGLFALHLRAVFLNNQSVIKYHGMDSIDGRTTARYDFSISRMMSGFHITRGGASAVVGTSGSFWADPETYDLRRLEFHADDLPLELLYSEFSTAIYYERVRIGESDVLLPQEADLRAVDFDGAESRDLIEFTHCQGFRTDSTLHFGADEGPSAAGAAAPSLKPIEAESTLPPDLRITVALTAPIDEHAAVGSLLEGKVVGSVMQKKKVLVPDGALVKGRIRRLERHADEDKSIGDYFTIALEFMGVELGGQNVRFYAELQDVDSGSGVQMTLAGGRTEQKTWISTSHELASPRAVSEETRTSRVRIVTPTIPGVGTFFIRGSHFTLPAGFKTVWKTQLFPRSATQ